MVGDEVMQIGAVFYVLGDINAGGDNEKFLLSNRGQRMGGGDIIAAKFCRCAEVANGFCRQNRPAKIDKPGACVFLFYDGGFCSVTDFDVFENDRCFAVGFF